MLRVKLAPFTREAGVSGVALTGLAISVFSLLALMSPDVLGDQPMPFALYMAYYYTLRNIVPVIGGAYGVDAGIYMVIMLCSFAILNRKVGATINLLQTVRLAAAMVLVFEVSLFFVAPVWRDVFVIAAQIGTPFQWFTNDDLMFVSVSFLVLTQLVLIKSTRTR